MKLDDEVRNKMLKIGGITIALGALYYLVCSLIGKFPPCIFNKITGLMCPGCGLTRMCLYMLSFDLKAAYETNRCVFVFMWLWAIFGVLHFIGKPKILRDKRTINAGVYFTICVYVLWGILRNIY